MNKQEQEHGVRYMLEDAYLLVADALSSLEEWDEIWPEQSALDKDDYSLFNARIKDITPSARALARNIRKLIAVYDRHVDTFDDDDKGVPFTPDYPTGAGY